jgi:hypothetical protein
MTRHYYPAGTLPLERSADRGGFSFGDDEHPASMVTRTVTGKRLSR